MRNVLCAILVLAVVLPASAALRFDVAAAAAPIDCAIVWHVGTAATLDASVQDAQIALQAPLAIGVPLRAVRSHGGARLSFAIDANDLSGLERAASGAAVLAEAANLRLDPADARTTDLVSALAQRPPAPGRFWQTAGGRRYLSLAAAASRARTRGAAAVFSRRDIADFIGTAAWLWLAGTSSQSRAASGLAKANVDTRAALAALAQADADTLRDLKEAAANGAVELIATPAYEPVLPLLVDSGSKSSIDPNIVDVHAAADAAKSIDDAIAAVQRLAPSQRAVGVYSPFGAYDDAAADLILQHHAAYALFSDRVVKAAGAGASASSVAAADAAAFHAYALRVDRQGVSLNALFWAPVDSPATSASSRVAARALADNVVGAARSAARLASIASGDHVIVLNVEALGAWTSGADYASAVDALVAALAQTPGVHAATPHEYLRANPDADPAYGFPPASSAGSLALWMGTFAQASLWSALVEARRAAGGDAALTRPATATALLRAESGRWFEAVQLPLGQSETSRTIARFREALAAVYRSAGLSAPASLARVKAETPAILSVPPTPAP